MAIQTDDFGPAASLPRVVSAAADIAQRRGHRTRAAAQGHGRLRGPGQGPRAARDLHRRRARPRRGARPRAAVRPAGPGQDDAEPHHRQRAGREPAPDQRPGAGKAQGPGRDPHEPRAQRRALHRRDPPAEPGRRGDPVPGARGLPDRHHDRRGPGRTLDQARPAALHAGRRHHARGHADEPAARPLRHRGAAGVLQRRRAHAHRHALGRAAERADRRRRRAGDRAPQPRHAAHRQPAAAPRARLRAGEGRRPHRRGAWPMRR